MELTVETNAYWEVYGDPNYSVTHSPPYTLPLFYVIF
jgi:hypothetical protein